MTFIWITYKRNLYGTWKEKRFLGEDYRAEVMATNFTTNHPNREIWLLIFCTVSMWIRVFYMLRYNQYLGKLSGVLEKLLYDIAVFFCFFLIEILFFAAVAELAFRKVDNYNTFLKSFRNLFYASFGQFNFEVFAEAEFTESFGIAFLVIFLVVNIGLFMSLFTAMMTTLYGAFVEKQTVYYMLETLKIRP
jgi:hypothetical protein